MSESQGRQGPPGWATVVRDGVSLVFAWVIVFKQAGILFPAPEVVSEPLLWLAGAMIGGPGGGQIVAMRFGGGGSEGGIGTDGLPSEPRSGRRSGSGSRSRTQSEDDGDV